MQFPPRLVEGYRAFVATRLPVERSRFQRLAQTGQQPETMIIGCCDSRVSPEVIFDARPGELDLEEVPNYLISQRDALNPNGNGVIYHDTNPASQYIADPYLHLIAFRELNY